MLNRLSAGLAGVCRALAAVATAVLAALITYVVFQRFVMGTTPHWAEELPRLVLVWAAFIGGVVCGFDRSHLVAGMLPYLVRNPRVLRGFDRFNQAIVVIGLATLGYAGWQLSQMTMGQTLPAIGVSAGMVYLALPVGCAAAIVVHLTQLFESSEAAPPPASLPKD